MAFSATTNWEVQSGGADGNSGNGGGFDPSNASMATDLAATLATTAAPVVTSASYNFAATDAGHWLYIQAGTNWKPGWYSITAVGSNAATINATAGAWVDATTLQPGTTSGCHSSASPTGGTWSVDYSQATPPYTFGDIAFGATTTNCTSSAHPFGPNHVGNVIAISAGTNFTVQRVQISSVSGTTATVDKSLGTNPGSGGTGLLGGPLATPGLSGTLHVASNTIWVKAATYACASGTGAGGRVILASGLSTASTFLTGYGSVRGDRGTKPLLRATANSVVPITVQSFAVVDNIEVTRSAAQTSVTGILINTNATEALIIRCKASGGIATGFGCNASTRGTWRSCLASAVVIGFSSNGIQRYDSCVCTATTSTAFFFNAGTVTASDCIAQGATFEGFYCNATTTTLRNCTTYNNTTYGFNVPTTTDMCNCLSVSDVLYGFNIAAWATMYNCAAYNTGSGTYVTTSALINEGFITLTGNPFVNAAGNDFSLNGAAGAGTPLRAAGYPSSYQGLSTSSYLDVGAAQHLDTSQASPLVRMLKARG